MLTLPSVWLALPSFGRRCAAFRSDPCPSKSFASFSPVCSEMRCWRTSTLCSSTARVCSSMHSETARLWNVLALLKDLCHHVRHATDNFLLSWAHGKVSLVFIRSLRKSLIRDGHDKRPLLEELLWNIRDLLMDVSRDVRYKHIHNLLSCALEKRSLVSPWSPHGSPVPRAARAHPRSTSRYPVGKRTRLNCINSTRSSLACGTGSRQSARQLSPLRPAPFSRQC